MDADVVVEPEVRALRWDKPEHGASMCFPSRAVRHTTVDLWVLFLVLAVADAVLRFNLNALVARGELWNLSQLSARPGMVKEGPAGGESSTE